MGLKQDALDYIFQSIDNRFDSYDGVKMLELGNQKVKLEGRRYTSYKYFTEKGFSHTSFDINGKDGAIAIDLSEPLTETKYFKSYDIVTNVGTSEHIRPLEGQYACFQNIHNCCKVGGLMIHIVPEKGSFPNHSPYCYSKEYFEKLAELNDYAVDHIGTILRGSNAFVTGAFEKKSDCPFTSRKDVLLSYITERNCSRKDAKQIYSPGGGIIQNFIRKIIGKEHINH